MDNNLLKLVLEYDVQKVDDCPTVQQSVSPIEQTSAPPDYSAATKMDCEPEEKEDSDAEEEIDISVFPLDDLLKLEEQITRIHWTVPILPHGELIKCLKASVQLVRKKLENQDESFQRFIRDSLVNSFTKVFTDDAVQGWKLSIYNGIYKNAMAFTELAALKCNDDCLPILECLGIVMNPLSKYHNVNQSYGPKYKRRNELEHYGTISEFRYSPKGWLVDFIDKFGDVGGFDRLLDRFISSNTKLTVPLIIAYLKPWGLCHEHLTQSTVSKYFLPIIEYVPQFFDQLSENDLKNETKTESKTDSISAVIKWLRNLATHLSEKDNLLENLDRLRLKIILRLLQTDSFSGKMNALNEINKICPTLYPKHRLPYHSDSSKLLTSEQFIQWIQENDILNIVLRDCLHQPQYVEKLERLLRFIIEERALTQNDLAKIWNSSYGKHEAIEKNVHDLLAKLAWYFSPEQLEQLFDCFRESWAKASKKQREKLLELIRKLAEDDKEGLMANKVLELLWIVSFDKNLPVEIVDQALAAHLKILDDSYLLDKDKLKLLWIQRILNEVKNNQHVLISLKQIRELCTQFSDANYPNRMSHASYPYNRMSLINSLETDHELTRIITENLHQYMEDTRKYLEEIKQEISLDEYCPDNRFNHTQQIQERLNFLKFILKEARMYLDQNYLKVIWVDLAENSVCQMDRELCFHWFGEMIDEVGFGDQTEKDIFQDHLMKLDPILISDCGMICFERFFKAINVRLRRLSQRRTTVRLLDDENLIGIEYLWKLILNGSHSVSERSTRLIKEIYTNISSRLKHDSKRVHQTFINECFERLEKVYNTMETEENNGSSSTKFKTLLRILTVLKEYLWECENSYKKERRILPMFRAHYGRPMSVIFRFTTGQNRQTEDFVYGCHSMLTWRHIRNVAHKRYQLSFGEIEIYKHNDIIDSAYDNRTLNDTDDGNELIVNVRWMQQTNQIHSSDESSSSDYEMNGHVHHGSSRNCSSETWNLEAENNLPSVILSRTHQYYRFLAKITDLGSKENDISLQNTAHSILFLLPVDRHVRLAFVTCLRTQGENAYNNLEKFYLQASPTQMLYNLTLTLTCIAPATIQKDNSEAESFYVLFLNAGGVKILLNILTQPKCTAQCDTFIKRSIYSLALQILKRFLIVLGYYKINIPNSSHDNELLGRILYNRVLTSYAFEQEQYVLELQAYKLLNGNIKQYPIPTDSFLRYDHIIELIRFIWCFALGNNEVLFDIDIRNDYQSIRSTYKEHHISFYNYNNDCRNVCYECLEMLTLLIRLVPSSVENLLKENFFRTFLIDIILYSSFELVRSVAIEQISLLVNHSSKLEQENLLQYIIDAQFEIINKHYDDLTHYSSHSRQFFHLLCRLLSFSNERGILPSDTDRQLDDEMSWLKNIEAPVDEYLLSGHLQLAKALLQFQKDKSKLFYGIDQSLIKRITEQFLFPASVAIYQHNLNRKTQNSTNTNNTELEEPPNPMCQSQSSISAAFELLTVFGTDSIDNFKLIDQYLTNLFFSGCDLNLNEWDYSVSMNARNDRTFVGLKNAGATCYMNSVLQQLFMIEPLRSALLSVNIPVEYEEDEIDNDDTRRSTQEATCENKPSPKTNSTPVVPPKDPVIDRKTHNIQILREIQKLFGHLLESKLQYHAPKGFWKIFKFSGESVNLRDQHDAVEFLNTVVDSIDEALKSINLPQICSKVLGGTFADQKICKDCPHRYTRDEDFTLVSVDIRHSHNLKESLEQYVIGELLDGPNAYFCEKCNKKVDTVKRTCFKKLPPVLAIQLKRFDYDWERETPIKFNDFFEFPRDLDMEPYTAQGLAKVEGTTIADEENTTTDSNSNASTRYKLVGIIVHMGQANGGHYYSFIQQQNTSNYSNWYKFDDTDVSQCKMDDDEELRQQCFGGEQPPSQFDNHLSKRQRRWWNAYILFYERIPNDHDSLVINLNINPVSDHLYNKNQTMPSTVRRSVQKQNIKFLHNRSQYNAEFFLFVKRLVQNNVQQLLNLVNQLSSAKNKTAMTNTIEDLALIIIQFTSKFLFSIGWHTKKNIRGVAHDWNDVVSNCLRYSYQARRYFAYEILFKYPNRFQEFLIDCSALDVRQTFSKILVSLATYSRQDQPHPDEIKIEENILIHLLRIIKKDTQDHTKNLTSYLQFFITYAILGSYECEQLIRFKVPLTLINLLGDDVISTSALRYGDPSKLLTILSLLIRLFDVSSLCKSKELDKSVLPNPFMTHPNHPKRSMPDEIVNVVYKRDGFLKKVFDDVVSHEECKNLLKFLMWENPIISSMVLDELFSLLSTYTASDLRGHLDVLLLVLLVEDSWQEDRILYALKGIPLLANVTEEDNKTYRYNEQQSLFEIFVKLKSCYQRRAYQFIKLLLRLLTNCNKASVLLQTDQQIKQNWTIAVNWLHDQLERTNTISSNFGYPGQGQILSNDSHQGHYLERTESAKSVLDKAIQLCSDKENEGDEEDENDDVESNSDDLSDNETMNNRISFNHQSENSTTDVQRLNQP